jgi:hypothetical protein
VGNASIITDKPNGAMGQGIAGGRTSHLAPPRRQDLMIVTVTSGTGNHAPVDWEVAYAGRFPR